ncbi:DoxX family protein [Sphingosinicella sp. BN140058]|uniref:DoxX family protein n=1 Tax=Sphingosinicella sp. BN140058 TaxID=1892855 RepID=UPI0010109B9F|nr:DoxX family protein [Sphingosinicella sp. BN140058]QAY76021.1 DoxX family protein [Sphingosinicella sp. BN140058]
MAEKTKVRIGWALTGLFATFMLLASVTPKLLQLDVAREALAVAGWNDRHLLLIGAIELACLILYLIPRTAILGAVLMMGLLGGAIASHLRVGSPMISHTLFGTYLGLIMWGGLWLRDPALRALFPWRAAPNTQA